MQRCQHQMPLEDTVNITVAKHSCSKMCVAACSADCTSVTLVHCHAIMGSLNPAKALQPCKSVCACIQSLPAAKLCQLQPKTQISHFIQWTTGHEWSCGSLLGKSLLLLLVILRMQVLVWWPLPPAGWLLLCCAHASHPPHQRNVVITVAAALSPNGYRSWLHV